MHSHAKSESYTSLLGKKKHQIKTIKGVANNSLEMSRGINATKTDTMNTQNVKSVPETKYMTTSPIG